MSAPKEIQALEAGLSETGKEQLEEIKAAVGLYGDRDPALPVFVSFMSILDRFERFCLKFAETVRKSAHEARDDAVKCGNIAFEAVIERRLKAFLDEIIGYSKQQILITRELVEGETAERGQDQSKNKIYTIIILLLAIAIFAAGVFGGIGAERYYLHAENKYIENKAQTFEQSLPIEQQTPVPAQAKPRKK